MLKYIWYVLKNFSTLGKLYTAVYLTLENCKTSVILLQVSFRKACTGRLYEHIKQNKLLCAKLFYLTRISHKQPQLNCPFSFYTYVCMC